MYRLTIGALHRWFFYKSMTGLDILFCFKAGYIYCFGLASGHMNEKTDILGKEVKKAGALPKQVHVWI